VSSLNLEEIHLASLGSFEITRGKTLMGVIDKRIITSNISYDEHLTIGDFGATIFS